MTDYYPHHSTYDHHQQPFTGPSVSYTGDPTEDNGIRRTATHGSHQSHNTQSHASVSASTRSWVYSNQMNPPPPLEPTPSVGHTPFHGPRPLPEPNAHYMASMRRPFHGVPEEDEDEEDYMHPPQHPAQMLGGLHFAYQPQAGGPARYVAAGPSLPSAQSSPVPRQQIPRRDRSFVGGFFKGLKRIPRMLRGGRDKRQFSPGTEAHTDITGLTTGNTLPRYLSNPSIGPTNPQFAHRLSQAVANGSLPADITPAAFQLRPALVSPQQPVVTVSPPSDRAEEEQRAEYFDGPPLHEPPRIIVTDTSDHNPANPAERATMMAYNRDSEAPTVIQTHPTSSVRASAPRRSPSVPRVSYPAELPTRASAQAQMEPFAPGPSTAQMTSPPLRSLHRPTTQSFASSRQTPRGILSPPATSAYTLTTATSYYDPSFSSDLTPVEKFFKGLYHLPWVSHGRVTVDYRPGDSPRAKGKLKSLKRPLSSWYYSVISRSRRNSVDLMSSNTASTGRESNILSSLASPSSRRSGRSTNHRHRSPRPKHHHRSRRRHTTSTSTGVAGTQRSTSPVMPAVYPYAIPPYLPYPYPPYTGVPPSGTMPATPPPLSPLSAGSPRGPRSGRSHSRKDTSRIKYPHGGYAPFQPLVMPPQSSGTIPPLPTMTGVPGGVYYITPSPPPHTQNGGQQVPTTMGTAPAVQLSPVIMHYVPAALRPDGLATMVSHAPANMMASPPATPQKPTAAASHNSHHSRHA